MKIRFIKTTPTQHIFEIMRKNGTHEVTLLETKSFMPHDLIHFAYESLVPCQKSFYGLLASGKTFKQLDDRELMKNPANKDAELVITEKIVGPLSSYLGGNVHATDFLKSLNNQFSAEDLPIPAHLTVEFLMKLKAEYRKLIGQWNSLPHHRAMEVEWPRAQN